MKSRPPVVCPDGERLHQMAEPRKVPFVTISSFNTSPTSESKKRRREDEADNVITFGKDGGGSAAAVGSGGCGGLFGNVKAADGQAGETKPTVRLNLSLTEPNDRGSAEFNYSELVQATLTQVRSVWRVQTQRPCCEQEGPNLASLQKWPGTAYTLCETDMSTVALLLVVYY